MSLKFDLQAYFDADGRCPFSDWFNDLDKVTTTRITQFLDRLENGNLSALKSVGQGVLELKMDFGPGYRVYLGRDGERLIILLCGGSKARQQNDIKRARDYWHAYKAMKRGG